MSYIDQITKITAHAHLLPYNASTMVLLCASCFDMYQGGAWLHGKKLSPYTIFMAEVEMLLTDLYWKRKSLDIYNWVFYMYTVQYDRISLLLFFSF